MEQEELKGFIHFLTHSKYLSKPQLRKIEELIVRDSVLIEKEGKPQKPSSKDETVRYHNPQGVVDFLRLFSIDDSLKWFTHEWDKLGEPFSIQSLIDNSKTNHEKLCNFCFGEDNKGIPAPLFYHVWNFISFNSTKASITDQFNQPIETKWADVLDWCKEHEGLWPGSMITLQGISFGSIINQFKRTIEFRTDVEADQKFGFQIKSLIRKAINGAVKVDFSERFDSIGMDVKFYCYVNSVYKGITKLCNWVASYKAMGDTLFIDLDFIDDCYILNLLHKDSRMSGSIGKIDGLSGDFKLIRETLFSTCDFEITTKFNDDSIKIIALDKKTCTKGGVIQTPTTIIPTNLIPEGVSYSLKFHV